jgi:hypothetical protein
LGLRLTLGAGFQGAFCGFEVVHSEVIGFSGRMFPAARHLKKLSQMSGPDEFFTKAMFCVLKKPRG